MTRADHTTDSPASPVEHQPERQRRRCADVPTITDRLQRLPEPPKHGRLNMQPRPVSATFLKLAGKLGLANLIEDSLRTYARISA